MSKVITHKGFLVISATRIVKYVKTQPKLEKGERLCALTVKVPAAAFETPQFSIEIDFGNDVPLLIESKITAAAEMLQGQGFSVSLEAPAQMVAGQAACEDCEGTGEVELVPGTSEPCQNCGGSGWVRPAMSNPVST